MSGRLALEHGLVLTFGLDFGLQWPCRENVGVTAFKTNHQQPEDPAPRVGRLFVQFETVVPFGQ